MLNKYEESADLDPAPPSCSASGRTDYEEEDDKHYDVNDVPIPTLKWQHNGENASVNTALDDGEIGQMLPLITTYDEIFPDVRGRPHREI